MLFKINAFYVDGKHLGDVLAALAGKAVNLEAPIPVTNAKVTKGDKPNTKKVRAISSSTSIRGKLIEHLDNFDAGDTVTTEQLKKFVISVGAAPTSVYAMTDYLINEKILTRKDKGVFTINERN